MVWRKGHQVLAAGAMLIIKDDRFKVRTSIKIDVAFCHSVNLQKFQINVYMQFINHLITLKLQVLTLVYNNGNQI